MATNTAARPTRRVERGDQLRQSRHLDPARDDGADGAADGDADDDQGSESRDDQAGSISVVTMAITMPTMPKLLPCREVSGLKDRAAP